MENNNAPRVKTAFWRSRKVLMIIFVVLQILFLSGITFSYYMVDWYGKEIKLQTEPFDPRDIFQGDYVILNYTISTIPNSLWEGKDPAEHGDVIYVVLKPVNQVYETAAAYPDKPSGLSGDEVVLKGRVDYPSPDSIRVRYGLERYYVPEGTGKVLEEQSKDMIVHVKIAPWGQVKITKVGE